MDGITRHSGRVLTLALVFAYAYLLAEVFGYAFDLVPGIFPLLAAVGVTLVAGGAGQWRRSSAPETSAPAPPAPSAEDREREVSEVVAAELGIPVEEVRRLTEQERRDVLAQINERAKAKVQAATVLDETADLPPGMPLGEARTTGHVPAEEIAQIAEEKREHEQDTSDPSPDHQQAT